MRDAVGPSVAVGCRFSAQEHLAGGLELDDTTRYAQALQAAGVDYLSVTTGVYESFVRIIPPMDFRAGWLLESAAAIRRAVEVPVMGVSRIVDPRVAEEALRAGQVDLVALGRALLTDPELPAKARDGRLGEIVSCIGCNQGCEARISHQLDVTCLVNPEVGRELIWPSLPVSAGGSATRRVAVVGGGPAGIEAARVCAERGHQVTLFERKDRLGGLIALAAALPDRGGWSVFLEQADRRLRASGAEVRLGEEIDDAGLAAIGADAVVLATGSEFEPYGDEFGSAALPVLTAEELLELAAPPGGRVVIVGSGAIGLGVAAWCAAAGAEAVVVAAEAAPVDPPGQGGLVGRLLGSGRVAFHYDREVRAVAPDAVELVRCGAIGPLFSESVEGVSAVVLTGTRRSRRTLGVLAPDAVPGTAARAAGALHAVGDCVEPRTALEAVYEGALAGRRI